MESQITREAAWELLREYNKDSFHLQHALTVEGVMRWYALKLGFASEVDFWGMVGLLHDIDFEMFQRSIASRHLNFYAMEAWVKK